MAVVVVVSVVLVCGVVTGDVLGGRPYGGFRERVTGRIYNRENEPFRGHYPRTHTTKGLVSSHYPDPSYRSSQETSGLHVVRGDTKEGGLIGERKSRVGHGQMYPVFIPVKLDINRKIAAERSLGEEDSHSPRLVMDEDFNIRFDNPYIIPLTKPLALVLDSVQRSREGGRVGDKVMIPFPVLVKARKPLTGQEEFQEFRSEDDVAEHRSNDESDFFLDVTPVRGTHRKVNSTKKQWKNSTTTYHKTNDTPGRQSKIITAERQNHLSQEEVSGNDSTRDPPTDVYPGKIFAEMYQTIPKYTVDSVESEELESHQYDDSKRAKEKVLQRPRIRPASRYPVGGHAFSASTDFEWVTHANSTKAIRLPSIDDHSSRRIVVQDVEETPLTTTGKPSEVKISEQYWREI